MIEKNTPKKFVADKDERLLEPGDMTEAQNVTITERGEGSGSILKTFKGTTESSPNTLVSEPNLSEAVTVIGKVEDPQRNFVYFFVADDVGSTMDSIIQHDPASDTYKTVLRSSWLAFDHEGFVKADIINKDFKRDGTLESVIYFTDNDNPPRKINVDRALAGEYDSGLKDFSLLTMRAAPLLPPTFVFDEDTSFPANNFKKEDFQFATQYVYKDGEESALSPWSKIASSPFLTQQSVVELSNRDTFGNVCRVSINWSTTERNNYTEVKKIKLLARIGNSNPFYIIEEFSPDSDLNRVLYNTSNVNVYSQASGVYSFYNEGAYQAISDSTSNKSYDNVPQTAEGQSITGNRLIYSNYREGYANNPVSPTIAVNYSSSTALGGQFHVPGNAPAAITYPGDAGEIGNGDVEVKLLTAAFDWNPSGTDLYSTIVPAGTVTRLSWQYDPFGTVFKDGTDVLTLGCTTSDGTFDLVIGHTATDKIPINKSLTSGAPAPEKRATVSFQHTSPESENVEAIADSLRQKLVDTTLVSSKRYSASDANFEVKNSTSPTFPNGANVMPSNVDFRVTYAFDDVNEDGNNDGDFKIRPYISDIVVEDHTYSIAFTIDSHSMIVSNEQSDMTYDIVAGPDPTVTYLYDQSNFAVAPEAASTFKYGSTHDFGVVYYDKWGRHGFVNKIGSAYVNHLAERTTDYGAASVSVSFPAGEEPPSWADKWQLVYSGSEFSNVFQYTVGNGYFVKDSSGQKISGDKRIFVSLKTLDRFQKEAGSLRSYSYTEGDILRVISYKNSVDAIQYPSANDGSIIEFEVAGVETLSSVSNPIMGNSSADDEFYGEFLVLRAPRVDGATQVEADDDDVFDDDLKYAGFDWNSLTNTNYQNDGAPTNANYWGQKCLIEILTPKKRTDKQFFYEIGEAHSATLGIKAGFDTSHGPTINVVNGDVRFRTVSCNSPIYTSGAWNYSDSEEWEYFAAPLECETSSDFISSKAWSRGRSHTDFEKAATIRRYNGITYSEAYADDTAVLNLSSFNPTLINFFDLPSEHGACKYIGNISDKLIAVQENKLSFIGVNKDVIETGSQSGLISLSTSVLNNISPFGGDYGTQNAESVLIRDGAIYFVDKSRRAIIRASQKGMEIISDKDIKSYVESQFNLWTAESGSRIVSGYDPDDNVYYVTLEPKGSFAGLTLGYNLGGFWQGTYTFYPTCYAAINDNFIVCRYTVTASGSHDLLFTFNTEQTNQFFDESIRDVSKVSVVSNENPSMVKQYNSISLEGDTAWTTTLESSTGQTTASLSFTEREDAFYADVSGDTSSNSVNHYIPVGDIASEAAGVITMAHSMQGLQIPLGYTLYKNNGISGFSTLTETVSAVDRGAKTISHSGAGTLGVSAGDRLFVAAAQQLTGDQIRGHYCKVKCTLTPSGTQRHELYSINTNFVNSKANHG